MKAQHLRIGNWVDYKGKYYQIYDGIRSLSIDDLDSESLDSHLKNIKLLDLHPIHLTEEILLKCGFEKEGSTVYINIGSIEIGTVANLKRFYIQISSKNITLEIKHLHQLQNLYFSLTGKELEINL